MGDREFLLREALVLIKKNVGLVREISKIYESTTWGVEKQTDYLNQIIKVETKLLASEVLSVILIIEEKLGTLKPPGKIWF